MNKEDFVTYEQALALKKLGFDYKCNHFYENDGTFKQDTCYGSCNTSTIEYYKKEDYADAPTLAQAQKWLLKNKGIYVNAIFDNIATKKWISCWDDINNDKNSDAIYSVFYQSPEEALSAGITECIKLLKNKNL